MPKTTNKLWNDKEDEIIRNEYPDCVIEELCKKMRRTRDSIVSRASILGVRKNKVIVKKKYFVNADYFKEINSKEKAYWYGFVWADGGVYKNAFEMTLNKKDLQHLKIFKSAITSKHPIKKHYKYNTFRFQFCSKYFVKNLNKLNVTERKSYTTLTPIIDDKYFINFLMGLFDGDGCFTCNKMQIVSTENVANWLNKKIYELYKLDSKIYNIKGSVAKRFTIMKKRHVLSIMNLLYKNNRLFLKRKKDKFIASKKDLQYPVYGGQN